MCTNGCIQVSVDLRVKMSKFRTVRNRIAALATLALLAGGIAAATVHSSATSSSAACASCLAYQVSDSSGPAPTDVVSN